METYEICTQSDWNYMSVPFWATIRRCPFSQLKNLKSKFRQQPGKKKSRVVILFLSDHFFLGILMTNWKCVSNIWDLWTYFILWIKIITIFSVCSVNVPTLKDLSLKQKHAVQEHSENYNGLGLRCTLYELWIKYFLWCIACCFQYNSKYT